ncbi:hypothetical protein OSB04_020009 [Centaurea solstitialis]|uniref:Aminotransferase-like plant mobile domain-containing protein n=1 Tax=Centaurea solstitialis TaxID=347529 RepID=A0AA38T2V2_9ASTR|nr:hypothetical protein OSB04_020009 [Centaurea solstitialis]
MQAFTTKFSLPSFLKQVNRLTESQRNSITRAGFGNLLHIPNHVLRRLQLNELMERWNSERRAFVFPLGEITITPLDVVLILGLRVFGEPVVINEDAPFTSLETEFGASVTNRSIGLESLKLRLESLGERDDEFFVRMFLLYCFGTLLFPTANGKVDSRYLYLFRDLDNVSCFAWGAAVLEDLHDCLSQRKTKRTNVIGGCLILLQIWCYEHIVMGRPKLLDCPSTFPRVCRWESSGRQYSTSSQFAINFEELEHTQASLSIPFFYGLIYFQILWSLQPTSEELQVDIIREIPQEWYSRTTMEQPLDIEDSQRATTTVLEVDEDEEAILRTGPGTIKHPIDVASERPIRLVREETFLRSGEGTMKHPIEVASVRASRTVRVPREEDHLQQKSTILVVSDDEESKGMEDLKKENLELKEIIEDLRNENQDMKKRYEDEIEELKKLLEKQQRESMLMASFVSNLERIVLEDEEDDL